MAIDTFFKNIADAIRAKAGTSGTLTPSQMPQAIADIPTGGGGIPIMEPLHFDVHASTYAQYYYPNDKNAYSDIYYLEDNHKYILFKIANSNRNRGCLLLNDPINASGTASIEGYDNFVTSTSGDAVANFIYTARTIYGYNNSNMFRSFAPYSGTYRYLAVCKTSQNVSGIKTYLLDVTDLT